MFLTIVKPSYEIMTSTDGLIEHLELCGRTCYKSEDKITNDSAAAFVRRIIKSSHESVLEHASVTVKIIGSRDMAQQLTRHRLGAYSMESQRFVSYKNKGFQFIAPKILEIPVGKYYSSGYGTSVYRDEAHTELYPSSDPYGPGAWILERIQNCIEYEKLLETMRPEDARSVLPNATKTEIVTTFNMRQWRHVFKERALNPAAQWQIREIMLGILKDFITLMPDLFGDLDA